jgi:hypothetical protein
MRLDEGTERGVDPALVAAALIAASLPATRGAAMAAREKLLGNVCRTVIYNPREGNRSPRAPASPTNELLRGEIGGSCVGRPLHGSPSLTPDQRRVDSSRGTRAHAAAKVYRQARWLPTGS